MIRIDNLSKSFYKEKKESLILQNINLTIKPGQITGLIGLNGAGKSTLIKVIAGLYKDYNGRVEFPDEFLNPEDRQISMLSSEQGLYNNLKVKKLIFYYGSLFSKNFEYKNIEIQNLVNFLGLDSIIEKQVSGLSSGWRQKLLIMLTFMCNPRVILLDEPSNFLDFQGQQQLNKLIEDAKSNGKYIIYASHNLYEIEKISDNIIFIHQGKIVFHKDVSEIINNETNKYKNSKLNDIIREYLENA